MSKVAVVTGAGSGVGRAVVLRMAREGWSVALIGRSIDSLNETVRLSGETSQKLLACPCDIAIEKEVTATAARIEQTLGVVTAVVNSAAINIPRRTLDVLAVDDFDKLIATNLNGAF